MVHLESHPAGLIELGDVKPRVATRVAARGGDCYRCGLASGRILDGADVRGKGFEVLPCHVLSPLDVTIIPGLWLVVQGNLA
jgi:hypothetical protein